MTQISEYTLSAIAEVNPDAVKIENFDECIIGMCNTFHGAVLLYDENLIIEQLKKGMTEEEAWEYYDFNILTTNYGEYSPVFLTDGS